MKPFILVTDIQDDKVLINTQTITACVQYSDFAKIYFVGGDLLAVRTKESVEEVYALIQEAS